jgi:hypothetical protein
MSAPFGYVDPAPPVSRSEDAILGTALRVGASSKIAAGIAPQRIDLRRARFAVEKADAFIAESPMLNGGIVRNLATRGLVSRRQQQVPDCHRIRATGCRVEVPNPAL